MSEKKKFYLTTAIVYASGKPHIGNTYEIILSDAIVRFKKLQGYDVYFQTGSDEHGLKNEAAAKKKGVTPKQYVDDIVEGTIKPIWDMMNTDYDRFIRTTDEDHERQVQKIFKKLYDQGDIYKGAYEGLYCKDCEAFWTKSQLVNDCCPDCGRAVTPEKEEAYFFKMSKYADRLIEYMNTHPEFITPVSRKNEMMNNFLLPGLQDLCVSRTSVKWGIPVDFDEGHVVYVWLDALSNYITGIGYDADGDSTDMYKKLWPADVHVIGKDIIRFHTIYWPIFLMALGEPLPKTVFGHPWLLQGGEKMSKSRGNVIYPDDLVSVFGVDATRFFVLHEMPFENDGIITWELMTERCNSELANVLGNLVNRTVSMSNKYFGGEVRKTGVEENIDKELKEVVTTTFPRMLEKMDSYHVADALTILFELFRRCNKYIDETEPWKLAKDESTKDRLAEVLYNLTESIVTGATLLFPFLPETAEKILGQMGAGMRTAEELDKFGLYPDGGKVTDSPEILFARLDPKEIAEKVEAIRAKQKEEYLRENPEAAEAEKKAAEAEKAGDSGASSADALVGENKPEITIDDFGKIELRVGEVIDCKAVEKSKKLLCSQVKIGSETRQILSGIRKWYSPEEMVGKKVVVVYNLKPAKLAGMESQGMILCAEDANGDLALVSPESAGILTGAEVC